MLDRPDDRSPPPPAARISDVLRALVEGAGPTLSVREIVDALGGRAFAVLVALLGVPNSIPMVPPIPFICGLLLASVAVQILLGWQAPWLPRRLLDRHIARAEARRAVERALPWIEKLERFSRPRLTFLDSDIGWRVVGGVLFVLALGLIVAAPIVGQIPLGIAVLLIGFGLVERDGAVIIAGAVVGAIGVSLSLGFAFALVSGAMALGKLVLMVP
jgi:hypothetical protein